MSFSDVRIKIIILYVISRFKAGISQSNLIIVLVCEELLDYFTLMQCVVELNEGGYISKKTIRKEPYYSIETTGTEVLEMFGDNIAWSIRQMVDGKIEPILDSFSKQTDIRTRVTQCSQRHFVASCGIYEWNVPLMELNLTMGSREQAEKMAAYFKRYAGNIFAEIFDLMQKERPEDEIENFNQ